MMKMYNLQFFGKIDPTNLNDYYEVSIDFGGNNIQIDSNFDHKKINPCRLDMVKLFVQSLAEFDRSNKSYIEQDYTGKNTDTAKTYIEEFIKDNDEDDLARFINTKNNKENIAAQLLKAFKLVRLGFYPDKENNFAVFDYTIDGELTDNIVVINTDQFGDIGFMTLES